MQYVAFTTIYVINFRCVIYASEKMQNVWTLGNFHSRICAKFTSLSFVCKVGIIIIMYLL